MAEIFTLSKNNTAEIKDKVVFLKIGLFKYEFPIQSITGLYRYNLTTANDLLVISYRIGNKTKRLQIVLDRVIPQPFVDELTSCIPASANLLHMKKKEALKIIGVGDGVKHGVIALAILVPLILAGIFFPQIYHSVFDSKLAHTTLEDIYKGNLPDSKYLAFTAELLNQGMIVTYRKFTSRTRSKKNFMHSFRKAGKEVSLSELSSWLMDNIILTWLTRKLAKKPRFGEL